MDAVPWLSGQRLTRPCSATARAYPATDSAAANTDVARAIADDCVVAAKL